MQKVVSIRMEEEAHHKLRLISYVEHKPMGDLVEQWINDHLKTLRRAGRSIDFVQEVTADVGEQESAQGGVSKSERKRRKKRK